MNNEKLHTLLHRLNNISVPNVADALDHLNIPCRWISKRYECLNEQRFSGLADTVQWGAVRKGNSLTELGPSTWDEVGDFVKGIEETTIPKVYVAGSNHSSEDFVLAGGITISYLKARKYKAAILGGCLRDVEEISPLDFPVWFEAKGVMDSQGCMKVVSRKLGCRINNFVVEQGDIVTGDRNGVVVVGVDDLEAVVNEAEVIAESESLVIKRVSDGEDLFEMISQGGHI